MINRQTINLLKEERKTLEGIIHKAEHDLSHAPEGSVLVKKYKKGVQFYYRENSKDRDGTYMPASDRARAVSLVQKSYTAKALSAAKGQWNAIDHFLKHYNPEALSGVFDREGENRQSLLAPFELSDLQYSRAWQSEKYEGKTFREDTPLHLTHRQERVRSKSEVLIANALDRAGIPYRYECPLKFGNQIIYPDFTILRISDRKDIYWEHLGLIDDTEYRSHAIARIREYEAHGIWPGINLILTLETFRYPLNDGLVQNMIKCYLK